MPRVVMDVPQSRVKIFARAVACMAGISDELYIEPSPTRVVLRSINSLRTVHLAVNFHSGFFAELQTDDSAGGLESNGISVRVSCRYFLNVFRNYPVITSARFELGIERDKLSVTVRTVHEGLIKKFQLSYGQEQSDKAEADEMTGCRLRLKPGQLSDVLANFHAKCENIQFAPSDRRLTVSSSGGTGGMGGTSISLSVTDLIAYEYEPHVLQQGAKVCERKPVKEFLAFSDKCQWEVTTSFDVDRAPIHFHAEGTEIDQNTREPLCSAALLVSAWEAERSEATPPPPPQPQMGYPQQGYPQQLSTPTAHMQQHRQPQPALHTNIDTYGSRSAQPQPTSNHTFAPDPTVRLNMDAPVEIPPSPAASSEVLATATPFKVLQQQRHAEHTETDGNVSKRMKAEPEEEEETSPVGVRQMEASPFPSLQRMSTVVGSGSGSGGVVVPEPAPFFHQDAAPKYPADNQDDDLLGQIGSWRPERYYSQVDVSQYTSQRVGSGYRVIGDEEVLEPSVSPPRE